MKIKLHIDYYTVPGETVMVKANIDAIANGAPMTNQGHEGHELTIDAPATDFILSYRYYIARADGSDRQEWGSDRLIDCSGCNDCQVFDRWRDRPDSSPFYTSAFVDCINRHDSSHNVAIETVGQGKLMLKVSAPMIAPNQALGIIGSIPAIGEWNESRAIAMNDDDFPLWTVTLDIDRLSTPFEFKFVIIDKTTDQIINWEQGDNRVINSIVVEEPGNAVIIDCGQFASPARPWRGAGVAIPVFSLRSDSDCGVGDFVDLKEFVDWAVVTGQHFIQVLPINDTTMTHGWMDSYPYNAISTTALHPMYLRLDAIATLNDHDRQDYYNNIARQVNLDDKIDYVKVNDIKQAHARELYAQEGPDTIASDDFKRFVNDNIEWLKPYAAFCILRDDYSTADFHAWGEYAVYNASATDRLLESRLNDTYFIYWQQYWLDRQLREAHEYARQNGIALKGDIPIGISTCSVEAWTSPHLFNLDSQAGAPPDAFAVNGQNWGFPTYNWEVMAKDNYAWWRKRFRHMANYFDAYRIDHILGFFRIWEIPCDAIHGLLGHFNPALPFSADELSDRFGFEINHDRHTSPYIDDQLLDTLFGNLADNVREGYLDKTDDGLYHLRTQYATQRLIANYTSTLDPCQRSERLATGLISLPDQVLFIEDKTLKGHYHPRIEARETSAYRALSPGEREAFDILYEDFFYHRHNDFWRETALHRLPPLLDSTSMLVCGEDLGMIPACVPDVMKDLRILSLEIQRMPKEFGFEFGDTSRYPYLSVCTTSTHDMGGIRLWWLEDRDRSQRFFNEVLHLPGEAPTDAEPWICDRIIEMHLQSPSMLCILPLADWLALDGRVRRDNPADELINIPANPRHYWRYRMHLTIGQLMAENDLNNRLKLIISHSGR